MEKELNFLTNEEKPITNFDDVVALLALKIPKFTLNMLDKPRGDDQTTFRAFLENKTDGSEWTDPLGFTVKIKEGEYIIR